MLDESLSSSDGMSLRVRAPSRRNAPAFFLLQIRSAPPAHRTVGRPDGENPHESRNSPACRPVSEGTSPATGTQHGETT
jgi:hypothetical protein